MRLYPRLRLRTLSLRGVHKIEKDDEAISRVDCFALRVRNDDEKGFTLAELLLGAAIMAFALVGLLALFISCMRFDEFNRNLSQATGHTQFVMEEIKNEAASGSLSDIRDKIDNGDWNWSVDGGQIADNGLSPVSEEMIVTTYDEDDTDPLDVTVKVTWKDNPIGVELKTSFSESGSGGAEEGDDEEDEEDEDEEEDDEDEDLGHGDEHGHDDEEHGGGH